MKLEERTVEQIGLLWPDAREVLERYGVDTCCGGIHPLQMAAAAHEVDLDALLRDLEAAGAGEGGGETSTIVDVRELAPKDRHPLIFSTFDALSAGESLTLLNDHDPRPLYYQFQAERAGQFEWVSVESGPERWAVEITRV